MDFKSTILCPCCRRRLGPFDTMPDCCPRCGTDLVPLAQVWRAAEACHARGVQEVQLGCLEEAENEFAQSLELVHTDMARKALGFVRLLLDMRADQHTDRT